MQYVVSILLTICKDLKTCNTVHTNEVFMCISLRSYDSKHMSNITLIHKKGMYKVGVLKPSESEDHIKSDEQELRYRTSRSVVFEIHEELASQYLRSKIGIESKNRRIG